MSAALGNSSKGLRVIADNLDATCLLRLTKTKAGKDGSFSTYTDVCTGVMVKEGFVLTSARFISSAQDACDGEAIFFYENESTAAGRKVPPVSVPLDPSALFYVCPKPDSDAETTKERDVDEKHLCFAVVGLDRHQIRPLDAAVEGADSSVSVEESILAFQEIIPMDIKLNNVDLSKGEPVARPKPRDQVVVIEHREGAQKTFHSDVIKNVKDLSLDYTLDRRPKTNMQSAGSPMFDLSGELIAMLCRAGSPAIPHHCVLLNPILSNLRKYMKSCRIKSAQMAKRGDFTMAAELMWSAVALNPSPSGDKVIEGLRATADIIQALKVEEGDLEELNEPLTDHSQAIEFNPRYVDAYISRGLVLHMQTKYEDAVRDFSVAIQIEPHEADYYYYRGHAFYDQGRLENAVSDYSNAINLDSENPVYFLNRGNAHTDNNDLEQAKKDYTSCIALAPEDENAYFRRGNVFRMLGQLAQAIQDYTKVLNLVPQHAAAAFQRGLCYYQKAHIDISKAFQHDPQPEYKRHLMMFKKT